MPTEKDIPTTGVSPEVPDGFEVVDVRSPSGGWRGGVEDGSVAWSGGEIGAAEFGITSPEGEVIPMGASREFIFEARAPSTPGSYQWPVAQIYRDGSVAEWAGPADSEAPAPVVEVAASGPESTASEGAGYHDHDPGAEEHDHDAKDPENAGGGQENAAARTGSAQVFPYLLLGVGVLAATAAIAGLAVLCGGRSRT